MPIRPAASLFALCILSGASLFASPASAFFGGSSGPKACVPYSDRFDVPGLWLGHFSGGRWALHPNGDRRVDWRSEYQCFFSVRECNAWRASLRREYARFRGHGTCLALRGGGRQIVRVVRAVSVKY